MDSTLLVPPALAGMITALALHLMLGRVRLPLDRPNERSLHSRPIPRSGGLALVPAVLIAWTLLPQTPPWQVWSSASALFIVSVLDDFHGLPIVLRFACHLAASAIVSIGLLGLDQSVVVPIGLVVAIAWMINLYNFMDGSDGLAGGMALIGFGAYGVAAWLGGDMALAAACGSIVVAAAAFLFYNFHPARVFLGDAGSIPLGLLAGSLGLLGWIRGLWPFWFPLLAFSAFIVDASVTLLRRALRGEKIWRAHREHYYQRLIRSGWGHRRTALAEYAVMFICGSAAILALGRPAPVQTAIVAGCALGYAGVLLLVDRHWQRCCSGKRAVAPTGRGPAQSNARVPYSEADR